MQQRENIRKGLVAKEKQITGKATDFILPSMATVLNIPYLGEAPSPITWDDPMCDISKACFPQPVSLFLRAVHAFPFSSCPPPTPHQLMMAQV